MTNMYCPICGCKYDSHDLIYNPHPSSVGGQAISEKPVYKCGCCGTVFYGMSGSTCDLSAYQAIEEFKTDIAIAETYQKRLNNCVSMIWAESKNGILGNDGNVPWVSKEDMEHFVKLTTHKNCIMGRRTWESIPLKYRPLKNRHNIILSKTLKEDKGYYVCSSKEEVFERFGHNLMIIGGKSIYKLFMNDARFIYHTVLDIDVEGDTMAPEIPSNFELADARQFDDGIFETWRNL